MLRACARFGQDPLEWPERVYRSGPFWRQRLAEFEIEMQAEEAVRRVEAIEARLSN